MDARRCLGAVSIIVLGIALFFALKDPSQGETVSLGYLLSGSFWLFSSATVKFQMLRRSYYPKVAAVAIGAAIAFHWWSAYVEHRHHVVLTPSLESAMMFLMIFGWPLVDVANILLPESKEKAAIF